MLSTQKGLIFRGKECLLGRHSRDKEIADVSSDREGAEVMLLSRCSSKKKTRN